MKHYYARKPHLAGRGFAELNHVITMIDSTKIVRKVRMKVKPARYGFKLVPNPPKDRKEYLRLYDAAKLPLYRKRKKELDAAKYERTRDKNLARSKEYHQRKKEEIAARKRAWRAANYERIRLRELAYSKSPRGRTASNNCKARRVALKNGCAGRATAAEIQALKEWELSCHYCGVPGDATKQGALTVDHFYPLTRKGPHSIINLVMACKSCNSRKSYLLPETWAKRSGYVFTWPLVRQPDGTFVPQDK